MKFKELLNLVDLDDLEIEDKNQNIIKEFKPYHQIQFDYNSIQNIDILKIYPSYYEFFTGDIARYGYIIVVLDVSLKQQEQIPEPFADEEHKHLQEVGKEIKKMLKE